MPATEIGTSENLLTELSAWVKMETPTTDAAAVNRLMDVAEADLKSVREAEHQLCPGARHAVDVCRQRCRAERSDSDRGGGLRRRQVLPHCGRVGLRRQP